MPLMMVLALVAHLLVMTQEMHELHIHDVSSPLERHVVAADDHSSGHLPDWSMEPAPAPNHVLPLPCFTVSAVYVPNPAHYEPFTLWRFGIYETGPPVSNDTQAILQIFLN